MAMSETDEADTGRRWSSRLYSAVVRTNIALLLAYGFLALAHLLSGIGLGPMFSLCAVGMFFVSGIALVCGLLWPKEFAARPPNRKIVLTGGLFAVLAAPVAYVLFWLATAFWDLAMPDYREFHDATVAEVMHRRCDSAKHILGGMIPPTTTGIELKDNLGSVRLALGLTVRFTGRVSEEDFRAFCKEKGYELGENDTTCNMNPDTAAQG